MDVKNVESVSLPAVSIPAEGTIEPIEAVFEDTSGGTLAKATLRLGSVDDLSDRSLGGLKPCSAVVPQLSLPTPLVDDWESGQSFQSSLLPGDFDWQTYLAANPDLLGFSPPINTEVEAKRHFVKYGANEITSKPSRGMWMARHREAQELVAAEVTLKGLSSTTRSGRFSKLFGVNFLSRSTSKVLVVREKGQQPSGEGGWTRLVGGAGLEEGTALATGTDGSVYMTGVSSSATLDGEMNSGGQDVFLTKLSPDGTKAWTRLMGGLQTEWVFGVTVGLDGSIYSVGYSDSPTLEGKMNNGYTDAFITKYSSDGSKVWTRLFGGERHEWGYAIATGSDGSIYASGVTLSDNLDGQARLGASQGYDAFITKYDPNGTKLWTRRAGGTGQDWGRGITAGTDGSVYVGGFSNSSFDGLTNSGGYDAFVIKYNPDGSKAWTRLVGGSGNETGYALTTGTDGSVYLSGKTASTTFDGQTNSGGEDAFLTKITPDGTRGWTRFLGGSGNEVSRIVITGIDSGIFVAGDTTSSTVDGQTVRGGRDAFITKYKPDGTKDWTRLLGGDGLEEGDGLAIDSNGDVYVSGLTAPTSASGQEGSTSGGTIGATLDGQTVSGQQDAFITKLSLTAAQTINFQVFELPN
jgi:hypothetical protein